MLFGFIGRVSPAPALRSALDASAARTRGVADRGVVLGRPVLQAEGAQPRPYRRMPRRRSSAAMPRAARMPGAIAGAAKAQAEAA